MQCLVEFDEKFDAAVLMGLFDYIKDSESLIKKLDGPIKQMGFKRLTS